MAPRQSSKSLATRSQTALAVTSTPVARESVALASERNFYKNKVRVLELDLLRLQRAVSSGDGVARAPDDLFQERLDHAIAGAPAPAPAVSAPSPSPRAARPASTAALSTLAASNAAMLRRQSANHQLALATAEVRLHREKERAGILDSKLTTLQALQRSPPYRVAKRVSRWGRFWKRLARRLTRPTR